MGNEHISTNGENQLKISGLFPGLNILSDSISKLDFSIAKIEQILHYTNEVSPNTEGSSNLFETRFRPVHVPLPSIESEDSQFTRQDKLKRWLGVMIKTVFSKGFHEFQNDSLSEKQTKIFCSENIILNLVNYSRKYHPSSQTLKSINEILKEELLPYCLIRYPESEEAEVNLNLNNRIKKTNDFENNANDLIYKSKIQFKYQENQNYNQTIMKFLNYIIQLPNKEIANEDHLQNFKFFFEKNKEQKEKGKNRKLYVLFQKDFQELFDKLYIESQFERMQSIDLHEIRKSQTTKLIKKKSNQNQKIYSQKVEAYTDYLIGRKLSENIKTFSEEEIAQGCLELKKSSLMRVVTKWCKQLRKNFQKPQKLAHKERQFRMIDGSQRYLNTTQSFLLEILLERRQKKIKQYLKEVMINNYEHQSEIANKNMSELFGMSLFSQEESTIGLFATINRKNYQTYLIGYLNVLIHNLLSVMNQFQYIMLYSKNSEENLHQEINNLENLIAKSKAKFVRSIGDSGLVPNLVTFKVSDLLRCKCSSREDQINALYNEIERISSQEPQLFEITKIENRLQRGTKDIKILLIYRRQLVVEVQLAINQQKSKFISYSDKFNHYIYELKRSQFGPISQLCSIWMNYDNRSDFYKNKFEKENKKNQKKTYLNSKLEILKDDQEEKIKFLTTSHRGIKKEELEDEPILKRVQSVIERRQNKGEIKEYSLPFRCFTCNYFYNESYFLGRNQYLLNHQKKICLLCVLDILSTYQNIKQLVLPQLPDLPQEVLERSELITKKNSAQQFPPYGILVPLKSQKRKPKYFKKISRGAKTFVFQRVGNTYQNLGKVTTDEQKKIFLEDNLVFSFPQLERKVIHISQKQVNTEYFLPQLFNRVNELQRTSVKLSNKKIEDKNLEKIQSPLYSVKKANLSENLLQTMKPIATIFPKNGVIIDRNQIISTDGLDQLVNLIELNLKGNHIKKITSSIKKLTSLKYLFMRSNSIQSLSEEIGGLNLEHLNIQKNKLKNLPNNFSNLKHLTHLKLGFNALEELPKNFGKIPLQEFSAQENHLKSLPSSFGNISSLKTLNLSSNNITSLPDSFGNLSSLQFLTLEKNSLSSLPESFGSLGYLQQLHLSQNIIQQLPTSFSKLSKLRKFYTSQNNLKKLPQNFSDLNIEEINFRKNQLQALPKNFGYIQKLGQLYLSENQLQFLPQSFGKLDDLKLLTINDNQISELPASFVHLKHLKTLNFSFNKLQDLPKDFFLLENLETLNFSNNKFQQIPQVIMKISNLKFLNLSSNKIQHLATEILDLQNLHSLILRQNPLRKIPKKILQISVKTLELDINNLDEDSKTIYEKIKSKLKKK